jgi:uncharacterized protein RhaS with RHS repeats
MESDGLDERFWTYDDFNRVTTATDPLGGITQYFYGAGGTACACWNSSGPTRVVSPAGRQTFSEYDLDWRLVKLTEGQWHHRGRHDPVCL